MARAYSNRDVMSAQFEVAEFDGAWKSSIGRPTLRGAWIVYGGSGCGKTTYVMQLCKYLTRFRRVAYNSLEQGLSLSLQTAWKRVGMEEVGSQIILLYKESLSDLRSRLRRRKSPDVIVIDSLQYWHGFKWSDYTSLHKDFPTKLFIYISHERGGLPDGKMGQKIRYDADVKVRVEGYKAFCTSRYENPALGEGGADYVIWQEGAQKYWVDNL